MRFAGIEIGSRTIELVVVDASGKIEAGRQADTGFYPITEAQKLVDGIRYDRIMATGATCSRSHLTHQRSPKSRPMPGVHGPSFPTR
jgi:hypothetical protein